MEANRIARAFAATACVAFTGMAIARAEIITFNDLNPGSLPGHDEPWEGPIPNGYDGFTWNNWWVMDTSIAPSDDIGYRNGSVTPPNVAYNGYGTPAFFSSTPFTLNSAYLTGAWNDGLRVEVQGFVGATLTYDNTYTVNTESPTLISFDYVGVDEVNFITSGGVNVGYGGSGEQVAMDDLNVTFTAVPEVSSTAVLVGLAALGMVGFKRMIRA